jgi:hypothetical protein
MEPTWSFICIGKQSKSNQKLRNINIYLSPWINRDILIEKKSNFHMNKYFLKSIFYF